MFIYMILFIQASGGSSRQGNFCVKVPQNLCSELRSLINCNAQPKRLNSSLRASNRQPLCCCFANIDYSLREEQFSNAVSCYSESLCVIASEFLIRAAISQTTVIPDSIRNLLMLILLSVIASKFLICVAIQNKSNG